jgi:hypothetical protein
MIGDGIGIGDTYFDAIPVYAGRQPLTKRVTPIPKIAVAADFAALAVIGGKGEAVGLLALNIQLPAQVTGANIAHRIQVKLNIDDGRRIGPQAIVAQLGGHRAAQDINRRQVDPLLK